jgi:glutaredoxin
MAKEYFTSKGFQYEEYNVMSDVEKREEMVKKTGQLGVPVIEIDGKLILGFDRTRINEYLKLN